MWQLAGLRSGTKLLFGAGLLLSCLAVAAAAAPPPAGPTKPAAAKPLAAKPGAAATYEITLPSKLTVSSGEVDIEKKVKVKAAALRWQIAKQLEDLQDRLKSGLRLSPPDAVPLWADEPKKTILWALAEIRSNDASGDGIVFHDGKDPKSAFTHVGGTPGNKAAALKPGAAMECFWDDVVVKEYMQYETNRWNGVVAAWTVDGKPSYFGKYVKGRRDGFCCLFQDGLPRLIVECSQGDISAVHVLSDGKVEKSFRTEGGATRDVTAGGLMRELDATEGRLKDEGRKYERSVRTAINAFQGILNSVNRIKFSQRLPGPRRRDPPLHGTDEQGAQDAVGSIIHAGSGRPVILSVAKNLGCRTTQRGSFAALRMTSGSG